jgi:hypothetical protein
MTGVDLYEAVAREMPDYAGRMVFMTGPIGDPYLHARLERLSNPRIDKPIDVGALSALITELLPRGRHAPAKSR